MLNFFYRFLELDLYLCSLGKEAVIAAIGSAFQGAGFWFSASLFHGNPFHRLMIPGAILAIIYWLAHFEDWNGFEIGGIALFQAAIVATGLCVLGGDFKLGMLLLVYSSLD
jgi:hypothetical protein